MEGIDYNNAIIEQKPKYIINQIELWFKSNSAIEFILPEQSKYFCDFTPYEQLMSKRRYPVE